jgi:hypothetical protein
MAHAPFEERKRLHANLDELIDGIKLQKDLASMESALRRAGFALLLGVLQLVLRELGDGYLGSRVACPCGCGRLLQCKQRVKNRFVQTMFGTVLLARSYYTGCATGRGWLPLDVQLGVVDGRSASLEHNTVLMGVMMPFAMGVDVLERVAGIKSSQKKAYEWTYRRGMFAWAMQLAQSERAWAQREHIRANAHRAKRPDTAYVMIDGTSAGIRGGEEFKDCKSVLIFWASDLHAMRNPSSKRRIRRYLKKKSIHSHVGPKEEFEKYLWNALVEQRVLEAKEIVWVADGAPWIWNLREQLLPTAERWNVIEILDYYHCKQNLHKGAKALFGKDKQACGRWVRHQTRRLWNNDVEATVGELNVERHDLDKLDAEARKVLTNLWEYLGGKEPSKRNRFRYGKWRSAGLIVSSGAIESVNHGVIQGRFKLPGMRFSLLGINALLRLRNAYFSGSWDALWEKILRPDASRELRAKVEELERHYENRAFITRSQFVPGHEDDELPDLHDDTMEDAA